MSEIKVNKVSPRSGTEITLGDSGDNFTIPAGASLTNSGDIKSSTIKDASGNVIVSKSGTTITLGASGDTVSVPTGATFDASNATTTLPSTIITTTGTQTLTNKTVNISSNTFTVDGTDAVGFLNTPVLSKSADYTLILTDSGKTIFHPSTDTNNRTFTIPANSSVAYSIGSVVTFINLSTNDLTIAITTDTLYLANDGSTGSRTLAQYGIASAVKLDSTTWLISGNGLS